MITIVQLLEQIKQDSILSNDLEMEIHRSVKLLSKYIKYSYDYKCYLEKQKSELYKLTRIRMQFYQGEAESYKNEPFDYMCNNAKQLSIYLESDDTLCEQKERISAMEAAIESISTMVDSLKFRNNHLRTILELRLFEAGA